MIRKYTYWLTISPANHWSFHNCRVKLETSTRYLGAANDTQRPHLPALCATMPEVRSRPRYIRARRFHSKSGTFLQHSWDKSLLKCRFFLFLSQKKTLIKRVNRYSRKLQQPSNIDEDILHYSIDGCVKMHQ